MQVERLVVAMETYTWVVKEVLQDNCYTKNMYTYTVSLWYQNHLLLWRYKNEQIHNNSRY